MQKFTMISVLPVLLLILAVSTLAGCTPKVSDRDVSPIAAEDVASWLRKGDEARLIIDVRSSEDFDNGHIDGAEHFDLPELSDSRHQEFFSRHKTLVVYGDDAGSARATAAAKRLLTLGYPDVRLLVGGLEAWRARGLPVED